MKRSREVRTALRIAVLVLALVLTQLGQAQTSGQLCVPPPAGLVSWWPGDGNANDIADGNNGTLLGATFFTAAEVGQGFTFASDGDGVTIPNNSNLNVNIPGFTADFWMRGIKNQPEDLATIFEKSHGWVDATGWAFQVNAGNGAPRFAIGNGGGFPEVIGAVDVLDGNFHLIAGTWDGTTMWLYVDGLFMGSASNLTPANNTRAVNVGFTWGGGTPRRFFRGTVDELEVYNRALTAAEIQSIFNAGSAGKCKPSTPGTVSLGGFIDSAGNIVNGSVLLLQNGPVPAGKATFGGNVQFTSGDPSPTGNVRYIDHVTGDDIKATSFTRLVIEAGPCGLDTHAMIMGKATVNNVPDQNLRIDVDDCSKPGSLLPGTPDTLVIMTGPTKSYTNGGPLVGGDIIVEKTQ